jgi:hypothetical protein
MSVFQIVPKYRPDLLKIAQDLALEESKLSTLAAVVFEDGTPDHLRDEFDVKLQMWANSCAQVSSTDLDDASKQEIYESALLWLQTSINHGFPGHSKTFESLLNNVACCFMRQRDWGRALTVLSSAFKSADVDSERSANDDAHDPVLLLNLSECLYEVNEQDEADNVLLAVLGTLITLSVAYHNFSKRILLRSDIRDHFLAFQCLSAAQALSEICSGVTIDSTKVSIERVVNPTGQDIRLMKEQTLAKLKENDSRQKVNKGNRRSSSTFEFGIGTAIPGLSHMRISSIIDIPKRVHVKVKKVGTLPNVNLDLALTRFRAKNRDREWMMQTSLTAWHSRIKSQIEAVTAHPSQLLRTPSAPFG